MLLVQLNDYSQDFNIFGRPTADGNWSIGIPQLNTDYRVHYRSFATLPKMYGTPFDRFEFSDHESRLNLVGFLSIPYGALSDKTTSNNAPARLTVPELMIWYVNHQVDPERMAFDAWIYHTPMLRDRNERSSLGILRSDVGDYYLFYILKGVVKYEKITETSFIQNGFITPLSAMMEKFEQAAVKKLEETQTFLAKLKDPTNWQLADTLSGSDLLRFVTIR